MKTSNLIALLSTSLVTGGVNAQAYPSKPIRVIVPYVAGSGTDTVTRLVLEKVGASIGQPFIIENRAGGNGIIGAEAVARAAPDGYTLLMGNSNIFGVNPGMYRSLPYDPVADFTPVSLFGTVPFLFLVNASLPVKTIPELITYASERPGLLNYGSGNTSATVWMEALNNAGKIAIHKIDYKSGLPAMMAVLSGEVQITVADYVIANPQIQASKLRALAVTGDKRSKLMPDLPTMGEVGLPKNELVAWTGLIAPVGTPLEIVRMLSDEVNKALMQKEMYDRLATMGFESQESTPSDFATFLREQRLKWTQAIKEANIPPQ